LLTLLGKAQPLRNRLEPTLILIRTRHLQELKGMEPRAQREGEEKPLTRAEAEKLVSEMRDLIGDAFKNHRDGDAERLLFKKTRRKLSR
jgi:hypothetical protein